MSLFNEVRSSGENYVVIGSPGAGKGTLAEFLTERNPMRVHVNSGNLLRYEVSHKTPIGEKIKELIHNGSYISDKIVTDLVFAKLKELLTERKNFILDGFPQSISQQELLEKFFAEYKVVSVSYLIIEVSKEIALERMIGRCSCTKCTKIYNIKSRPSKKSGICDNCSSPLERRSGDEKEKAEIRLKEFNERTQKLIEYVVEHKKTNLLNGERHLEISFKDYTRFV